LDRSADLRALAPVDRERLHARLHKQRRGVLASDGLQADRQAKKELNTQVRGVRSLERQAEKEQHEEADSGGDYGVAVRSALTAAGHPPLAAAGLNLPARRGQIAGRLDRVATKARRRPWGLENLRRWLRRGLEPTAPGGPPVGATSAWVKRGARLLETKGGRPAQQGRRGRSALLSKSRPAATQAKDPVGTEQLRGFVKVTKRSWGGLSPCHASPDLPRTTTDLEPRFGSQRSQERRASRRKQASPGLVVPGSVRGVARLATRLRPEEGLKVPAG
jgi:hypothetical protein